VIILASNLDDAFLICKFKDASFLVYEFSDLYEDLEAIVAECLFFKFWELELASNACSLSFLSLFCLSFISDKFCIIEFTIRIIINLRIFLQLWEELIIFHKVAILFICIVDIIFVVEISIIIEISKG